MASPTGGTSLRPHDCAGQLALVCEELLDRLERVETRVMGPPAVRKHAQDDRVNDALRGREHVAANPDPHARG